MSQEIVRRGAGGMREEIAWSTTSERGGECDDVPEHIIPAGGLIFKISEKGFTTEKGNGPGRWVCLECAYNYPVSMHYLKHYGQGDK